MYIPTPRNKCNHSLKITDIFLFSPSTGNKVIIKSHNLNLSKFLENPYLKKYLFCSFRQKKRLLVNFGFNVREHIPETGQGIFLLNPALKINLPLIHLSNYGIFRFQNSSSASDCIMEVSKQYFYFFCLNIFFSFQIAHFIGRSSIGARVLLKNQPFHPIFVLFMHEDNSKSSNYHKYHLLNSKN